MPLHPRVTDRCRTDTQIAAPLSPLKYAGLGTNTFEIPEMQKKKALAWNRADASSVSYSRFAPKINPKSITTTTSSSRKHNKTNNKRQQICPREPPMSPDPREKQPPSDPSLEKLGVEWEVVEDR